MALSYRSPTSAWHAVVPVRGWRSLRRMVSNRRQWGFCNAAAAIRNRRFSFVSCGPVNVGARQAGNNASVWSMASACPWRGSRVACASACHHFAAASRGQSGRVGGICNPRRSLSSLTAQPVPHGLLDLSRKGQCRHRFPHWASVGEYTEIHSTSERKRRVRV